MMNRILARFWNQIGMMHRFIGLRRGRRVAFQRAERAFTRAVELDPGFIAPRYNRGLLFWRELDQAARAILDFTVIIDYQPEALFMRGMAQQAVGNYRAAFDDLAVFVGIFPDSRWNYNARSQLHSLRAIVDDLPLELPAGHQPGLSSDTDVSSGNRR